MMNSMWTWVNQDLGDFSIYSTELKIIPSYIGGEAFAIQAASGSDVVVRETIILTINDVLQAN